MLCVSDQIGAFWVIVCAMDFVAANLKDFYCMQDRKISKTAIVLTWQNGLSNVKVGSSVRN